MQLKFERLSDQEFYDIRKTVLNSWPTGAEVDLDEAIEYQKQIPRHRNVVYRLLKAREEGDILTQPRAGISPLNACKELFQHLQDDGKADILPTSTDAYTRANRYENAEEALKKSEREGRSFLNGLPVVNYGIKGCRELFESLNVPMELRSSAPDNRLSAEITLASGYTASIHGPLCTTMHYSKNYRLARAMEYYQYTFRLMGEYTERGIPIAADVFGLFSNVGVPQSLVFAGQVIEVLQAAVQGLKHIWLNVIMQGNLIQDIASTQVLPVIMNEYLKKFGFHDVTVMTVANDWTGPYPEDYRSAYALDAINTVAAVMGGANQIMVKSVDQGCHLPSKEANASALKFTRVMIDYLKNQRTPIGGEALEIEKEMIMKETRLMADKMIEMGDGDPLVGAVNAFESGIMEAPFSSNMYYNKGSLMFARDCDGICRYFDIGKLPLSPEIVDFHTEKLKQRKEKEQRTDDIGLITDSILSLSKEYLV